MKPIVIAFGEHDHATAALRWAAELALLAHAPLTVLNVWEPTYAELAPDWLDELVAQRKDTVQATLEEVGHADANVVVLDAGEPIDRIAGYLATHDVGLVVTGAHDRHRPGGFGGGTPALHLLHHTDTPVAVVRPDYDPLAGGTVVVGVDGSGPNAQALRRAEEIAAATSSTLHAVYAYDPADDSFPHPYGWHRNRDEIRAELAHVRAVPSEIFWVAGHPTEALIEHAQRERASAIVVGTRGRGGFDGLFLGRVPSQVIAHASCPVIVVPHTAG